MTEAQKLHRDWKERLVIIFKFHPDAEKIMNRILDIEPIGVGQLDKWFREADEFAEGRHQIALQELSGEPDETKAA